MANLVVHFEIHASDPQRLIDYYSSLLGWTFQDYGGGEQPYWVIDTGEGAIGNAEGEKGLGINGGLTPRQGPGPEVGAPGHRVQHRDRRRRRRRAHAPRHRARRDRGAAGDRLAGHRPRRLPHRSRRQRLRPHLAGPLRWDGRDGCRRGGVTQGRSAPATRGRDMSRSILHRRPDDPFLPIEGHLPSFDGATGWLNSEPLTPEGLRGRVVAGRLLDLHLHQLAADAAVPSGRGRRSTADHGPDAHRRPHARVRVRAGHRQRHRAGARASASSIRSRSTATTASGARSRTTSGRRSTSPTREGRIRYHHFGEGEYAMTEMVDPAAPARRRGATDLDQDLVVVEPQRARGRGRLAHAAVARDVPRLRPEPPASRQEASRASTRPHVYAAPARLPASTQWALVGDVDASPGTPRSLNAPGGRIAFQFHARDVNLVMGPATRGTAIPFRVFLDGELAADAPRDRRRRRRQRDGRRPAHVPADPPDRRRSASASFEIEFLDAGVEAYCFTFG